MDGNGKPLGGGPGRIIGRIVVCGLVGLIYLAFFAPRILTKIAGFSYSDSVWFAKVVSPSAYHGVTRPFAWLANAFGGILPSLTYEQTRIVLLVGMIATAGVIVFSAVRSLRHGKGAFTRMTASLCLGLFLIPFMCWGLWLLRWVIVAVWWLVSHVGHFLGWLFSKLASFFVWSLPFWKIVGLLVLAAIVILVIRKLWQSYAFKGVLVFLLVVAAVVGCVFIGLHFGWWRPLGLYLGIFFTWIGHGIVWVFKWLLIILAWVLGVVVVCVAFVGIFVYPGFILFESLKGAFLTGSRDQREGITFSSGVGAAWSLILTSAATSPLISGRFADLDPVVMPRLISLFRVVIPGSFKTSIAGMLTSYDPRLDLVLLAGVAAIGCLTLAFGRGEYDNQGSVLNPVFIAWVILLAVFSVFITPALPILIGIVLAGVNVAVSNSN